MSSGLNPEAPEFYPHFATATQNGFKILGQSIQASKQLPTGASHSTFKTFTDFNIITKQLTENVLVQSNRILAAESEVKKLKSNDNERNYELVVETNDNILDRTNIQIDVTAGINKAVDPSICGLKNPLNHVASWNTTPIIHKIQMGSAMLIGAKNIPRPQLNFKDPVDNSNSLWVPKISDKPNNIKPLALSILYNDNGEAVGYEHPYQMELELYRPPKELLASHPEPPAFPPSLSETPLTRVDTEAELDRLVQHLRTVKELAVDVEHHSYRTYQGITCLIQLSTDEGGDFIVDTIALREHIYKLNDAFTDPKKLKVFHGAEMDIIWLQRDFGVYVVGLFDTYQAAKLLKHTGLSLKNLLMRYCKVDADKKYQLADWRMRPLPAELVQYARVDTHYLLYVWRRMRSELMEAGAGAATLLQAAFEQSRQVCGLTYNKEAMHEHSHLPLYRKSKKSFNSQQLAALKLLYKWRDAQARELDESTSYLLPNQMLLTLAESLPGEVQGVNACCSPMPPFVKQHLITIHRMLLSCRELPLEPQLYQMPLSISTMLEHTRQADAIGCLHDLSHFPDYRDDLPIAVSVKARLLHCGAPEFTSDIPAFQPASEQRGRGTGSRVVSDLNADAKSFIPPYERYKKYRCLAQIEEIKEFKEKEAKISAIGKGDDMIKKEVLDQLKHIRNHSKSVPESTKIGAEIKHAIRKRKMSSEIAENKKDSDGELEKVNVPNIPLETPTNTDNHKGKSVPKNQTKPYDYKNANYKKFFDNSDKFVRKHGLKKKQPKTSFKKHRK